MIRMGVKIVGPDGTLTKAGYEMLQAMARDADATAGKVAAVAAVAAPTGGTVIDVQARAAIDDIRGAAV